MNDFDSLREDFGNAFSAINDYAQAQRRHAEAVSAEVERLWADNAELRDELHALANRVETLTRARLTEPAETAAKMVDYDRPVRDLRGDVRPEQMFTCRLNPGCNVSWPHIHNAEGAVIRVESAEDADHALEEVERVRRLYPRAFGGDAS